MSYLIAFCILLLTASALTIGQRIKEIHDTYRQQISVMMNQDTNLLNIKNQLTQINLSLVEIIENEKERN